MSATPRDLLVRLLAGAHDAPADSAGARLSSDALRVHVAEVGELTFPVRAAQAKKLIAAARPAAFGHREQTLHDTSVRDTWELTPDQVRLDGEEWQHRLDSLLEVFRDDLGLPPDTRLRAELHSMLVYGKGQFFAPHQDSEKHDEMVATLVVSLPSLHTGGELVIDDRGKERVYSSSHDELTLVAFYADRRHEVRPVRSGYRVALTFNLLATTPTSEAASGPVARAADLLTEHFASPAHSRYGGRELDPPIRLAFLLDHEYTQRALATARFKGADAERVGALRAAASRSGCECVFALAEVHETRDAQPGYGGQHDWYDDESESYDDAGTFTAGELIDDEISLSWWIAPGASRGETIQLGLGHGEVCAATPSAALTPYESEYEGYMGNYGNTVDRWYRRAAIVVWPKEKEFANRAEASPAWALRAIRSKVSSGDLDGARAAILSIESFWKHSELASLGDALPLASALRDPAAATVVLAPYRLETLTAKNAKQLASAVAQYGDTWWAQLLDRWAAPPSFADPGRVEWITAALAPVCRVLADADAVPIAEQLSERMWQWLWQRIRTLAEQEHPGHRAAGLTALGAPVARTIESSSAERATSIVELLRELGDHANPLLLATLRARETPASPPIDALAQECWERLVRRLARPERAADDWSIAWSGCGCADCKHLGDFLHSPTQQVEAWPLAQQRRQHIHSLIDRADLPVSHVTRRQGRPYTLVLTKTAELFAREATERRDAEADLRWLLSMFE